MPRTGTFGGFHFDAEVFTGYMQERDTVNPLLIETGVLAPNALIANAIANEGNVFTIPMYQPLEGDAKNYDGLTNNTPEEVSAKKQTGMSFRRMNAWKSKDFTKEISGANPMGDIASKVAKYIQKNNQKELLAILNADLGVAGMEEHNLNKASEGEVTEANYLAPEDIITLASNSLGADMSAYKLIAMHSLVYANLMKKNLVEFTKQVSANAMQENPYKGEVLGLPIVIDDTLTVEVNDGVKKYHTYLLGEGVIQTAPVRIDRPNSVDYDAETAGGIEKLYTKWGRAMHPNGFTFNVSNIVSESPTREELGNSANYTLVMNAKNVAIAKIVSNG
jgi:hypothetical protein